MHKNIGMIINDWKHLKFLYLYRVIKSIRRIWNAKISSFYVVTDLLDIFSGLFRPCSFVWRKVDFFDFLDPTNIDEIGGWKNENSCVGGLKETESPLRGGSQNIRKKWRFFYKNLSKIPIFLYILSKKAIFGKKWLIFTKNNNFF